MRLALIAALGVAVLLASVGGGTAGGVTQAENETTTENTVNTATTTIRVSAVGEAEAEPDQALLRVAVVQSGDDAEMVRTRLAKNVSRLREALRQIDVSDEQIRTVAFDIRQDRDEEGAPADFRGIHTFEITLNDTDRVGSVIDTAVKNGANEVDGVAFTLSEARRDELRARALQRAMQSARTDAESIAGAENLTVTGVRTVSTVDSSFVPVETRATTVADAGGKTEVESGPVTVAVQVVVTYEARSGER
ncbi:SIMPL domain-containing protein [Haladaptatus sp. NG-SE-30]